MTPRPNAKLIESTLVESFGLSSLEKVYWAHAPRPNKSSRHVPNISAKNSRKILLLILRQFFILFWVVLFSGKKNNSHDHGNNHKYIHKRICLPYFPLKENQILCSIFSFFNCENDSRISRSGVDRHFSSNLKFMFYFQSI